MRRFTVKSVGAWSDPAQGAMLSLEAAVQAFHALGPRATFIRTVASSATLLDVGAGDGSTVAYRSWPGPARPDITMLAWASVEGAGFPDYDGYEVGRWPEAPPNFGGREFEAIFCANFIEHIIRPLDFVRLAASRLAPGGRLYLEWPTETSIKLPTRFQFQDAGLPVMIGAYHDDPSHRQKPPLLADVRAAIVEAGLTETSWGVASVPFIDQQLAIRSREAGDMVGMTLAYWSHTGWTQYLVAEKY